MRIYIDGRELSYKCFTFSGGEVQVKLDGPISAKTAYDPVTLIKIVAQLTDSSKIMELALLVDALRRQYTKTAIALICSYLPYARQDRVCDTGEALGIKVMCDIINSLNFVSVEIWDAHSDVALALLDRVKHRTQTEWVSKIAKNYTVLVAPDAGAIKKTLKSAQARDIPMVRADKIRDVKDGSITGTKVYSDHIGTKDFLIVDDICDGGRTFIELAKELKPLTDGHIYLYVTHGIFSKGLDVFNGLIDHLYCANPFPNVDVTDSRLTVVQ